MSGHKDPEARRAYQREYMRRRYQNDPLHREKQKTRSQTARLVKKMQSPPTCGGCGSLEPEGHHPNIVNEPDKIVWLCRDCHRQEHLHRC